MTTNLDERPLRMVSAWVEPDPAHRLEEAAAQADRSKSAELRVALRRHLERGEQAADDDEGAFQRIDRAF